MNKIAQEIQIKSPLRSCKISKILLYDKWGKKSVTLSYGINSLHCEDTSNSYSKGLRSYYEDIPSQTERPFVVSAVLR
ncbi:hypothetical protein J6590_014465 [Homalodisca vitripennis]|nr:hypothetical protein J6590_014465 [Homalodisca vitripennis]